MFHATWLQQWVSTLREPGSSVSRKTRSHLHRQLRVEPLEDRRLLANVTVGNGNDVVNGTVTSIAGLIANDGGDGISLREAILAANVDSTDPADTIDFAPTVRGVIQLTNALHPGEIVINSNLTINGPGALLLTVRAFSGTTTPGDGARIFNVNDVSAVRTVAISGMTLTGGDAASSIGGGAILNSENLTVSSVTISGNSAGSPSVGYHGAGIANFGGTLTVRDSLISGNSTTFGDGAGIYSNGGTMTIERSTIRSNHSGSTGSGGGIHSSYTMTNITDSAILSNSANVGGGVLQTGIGATMTITNSTISENDARTNGGGVEALFGNVVIRHSTITLNRADDDLNSTGNGGGVFVHNAFSSASFDHTIIAGNLRGVSTRSDVFGAVTTRYSLVGDNTGSNLLPAPVGLPDVNGNMIGSSASPIDAMLVPGSARDNGGKTWTHELLPASPAIDRGESGIASPPADDQRGGPFVRIFDGDGAGGARIDIGSYERQTLAASFFVVDTLIDELDGNYAPGDISLRDAVSAANGSPGADTISFAAALTAGGPVSILLTKGEMELTESTTINGPGAALLTIDASGSDPTPALNNGDGSRIFLLNDQHVPGDADMSISGLTLTGGDIAQANGFAIGGAIFNSDRLTLTGCVISDNSADHGGGIGNRFAELEMIDCTISGNSGREFAGGIYSAASETTIQSSTITGNSAEGFGGGIAAGGPLIILDSTIAGNSAQNGGGIYGSPTIVNSTISDNTAQGNGGGVFNHGGYMTIASSRINGNEAYAGGGVYSDGENVTITNSSIFDNDAFYGGGLLSDDETLEIEGSTFSDNRAALGGGIYFSGGPQSVIRSSTISGNDADLDGGGILVIVGHRISLEHITVTDNTADADNDGDGKGGGIHHHQVPGVPIVTILDHSLVANNRLFNGARDDFYGGVQARFSLIGDNTGIVYYDNEGGNQIGTALLPIDPLLGPLADNGGPTMTHALLAGSPAIDAGDPNFDPDDPDGEPLTDDALYFDQRGQPFDRIFDSNNDTVAKIDIGAFELGPGLLGDYNRDGRVDALDYTVWRNTLGQHVANFDHADGDGDGVVDPGDYAVWKMNYGNVVPPPFAGAGGLAALSFNAANEPEVIVPADASPLMVFALGTFDFRVPSTYTSAIRPQPGQGGIVSRDEALIAWLEAQSVEKRNDWLAGYDARATSESSDSDSADAAYAELGEVLALTFGGGP